MTRRIRDVADQIIRDDLIGCNIHYHPETGEWNVWTRKRGSDGWSISGRHTDLETALFGAMAPDEDDDIMDLV